MVPEGFKAVSGVGVVPQDWLVLEANEVSKKVTKGTTPPKKDVSERGIIPFLRVNNLSVDGYLDKSSHFIYVSEEAHNNFLARSVAYPDDVLMNIVGPPLGKTALLGDEYKEYNMNQAVVFYRLNKSIILPNYFLLFLSSGVAQGWLQSRSKKTSGQQNLTIELCKQLPVPVPPLTEQSRIAQLLSAWNKAITTTEQLLVNSRQQKKALMQQLLTGKQRLLDKDGVRFSGEWEWLKASDLFKTVSKKNNSDDEELLAVTQDQGALPRSLLERRVVMPDGTTQGYKLVVPGNFIISLRSFQGGLEYSKYRGLVSPAYTVLEPIKQVDDNFFKHYYKSYNFIGHLAVAVIGIRDGKQISYADFSFLKLPYPSLEEQQKIAAVLSTADREIDTLQLKLDTLKQEKKALMQQLLTGKRRVKTEEAT
ncbi:restriction endonuclease subunit S [Providencia sp. M-8]|uniref:restriction endonuclease subunit S n=1 Tax=Providencia sp. M-8 TaxID=2713151 RepID=UPI0014094E15